MKIQILLLIILLPGYQSFSQGQDRIELPLKLDSTSIIKSVLVELPDSSSYFKNDLIIIFANNNFICSTTRNILISSIKKHIKNYEIEDDKELLKKVKSEKSSDLTTAIVDARLKSRLYYRISDIIQSKQCIILNNERLTLEKRIIIQKFSTRLESGTRITAENGTIILDSIEGVF